MERLTIRSENPESSMIWFKERNYKVEPSEMDSHRTRLALQVLASYEDLELTPEQIREVDKLYAAKCKEVAELKKSKWIPVTERLPEEHDSIYAKFYGTDKWTVGMFRKTSDYVNVTAEYESGRRRTEVAYTADGKWMSRTEIVKKKYIAWMPFQEPYNPESMDGGIPVIFTD